MIKFLNIHQWFYFGGYLFLYLNSHHFKNITNRKVFAAVFLRICVKILMNFRMSDKTIIYSNFSEQLSKVLWVIAVCQNHDFRATRSVIASILKTNTENISFILNQIKKKNKQFVESENVGSKVLELSDDTVDISAKSKDRLGYLINIEKNISTSDTAKIALAIESFYAKSVFYNEKQLCERLFDLLNISIDFIEQRVKFLLKTDYLEIHKTKNIIPSRKKRIQAEYIYLNYLADNPNPSFISNLTYRRSN